MQRSAHLLSLLSISFVLGALLLIAPAVAQTLEVTVANGATSDISGADGACRRITNGCGATVMVPSKTVAEWQSYYGGAKPSCVTVGGCPVNGACGGCNAYDLPECAAGNYSFVSQSVTACTRTVRFSCLGVNGGSTATGCRCVSTTC